MIFVIVLLFALSSCLDEDSVEYRFEIANTTETPMEIHLSSWGGYTMYINEMYDSKYKFHEVETIHPHSSIIFSKVVGNNPEARNIPNSLIPPWNYITSITCNGVIIPKEYYANQDNWEINVAYQLNGTFTHIDFYITQELIERFQAALP